MGATCPDKAVIQRISAEATIRERAYQLWKDAGEPSGLDREFWERAERSLAVEASELNPKGLSNQVSIDGGTAGTTTKEPANQRNVFSKGFALLNIKGGIQSLLRLRRANHNARARSYCRWELRHWRKAEFISASDRKKYAKEFCLAILHIHKYMYSARETLAVILLGAVTFAFPFIYTAIIVYEFPRRSLIRSGLIATVNIDGLVKNQIILYVGAYILLVFVILSLVVLSLFVVIGLIWVFWQMTKLFPRDNYRTIMLVSVMTLLLVNSSVIFAMHSSFLPNSEEVFDVSYLLRLFPATTFVTIVVLVLYFLLGIPLAFLQFRSFISRPDAVIVGYLFSALWNLQRSGPDWTALDVRASSMDQIAYAGDVARSHLLRKFERADRDCNQWRRRQAARISAGFAEKQTWLITPKSDTREVLFSSLGAAIVALLSGNWDRLELVVSPVDTQRELEGAVRRTLRVLVNLGRTGLIALFPLAMFIIANYAGILTDVDAHVRGYIEIGLFVWAAMTVLFRLDPLLKEKLAAIKEAAQILRPGSSKE